MNNSVESIFFSLKSKEEKLKYLLSLLFSEPRTKNPNKEKHFCVCVFMSKQLNSKNEGRHRRGHVRIT